MSLSDTLREAFLPERSAHADRLPRRLLREISRMPRLTGILPYVAWQDETRLFALDQGAFGERESQAIGFCIEALPQTGANDEMEKVLASLFVSCPPGTGIQVTLYGSPNILPVLQAQANLLPRSGADVRSVADGGADQNGGWEDRRHNNIFRLLARRRIDHYLHGTGQSIFYASDLSAARFSGRDLDHPAARPRGAGRCRRGAACPGKCPRHAQVGTPAGS
jgi:conjugal transfer ATP-binding protein TraC